MGNIFLMRYPGGRAKALTLSFDDGVETDFRLADLMRKAGVKGTFNINSGLFAPEDRVYPVDAYARRMKKSQVLDFYAKNQDMIEIGLHTLNHGRLDSMDKGTIAWEVAADRKGIEDLLGIICRGMAYPYGTYSDAVIEVLKNCGVAYARTTESTGRFALPVDWLRWPATCHHASEELMTLAQKFLLLETDRYNAASVLFYLWGHSYEFERDDNWAVIEEFFALVGGRGDVWYATNLEIYEYIQAYRRICCSADGRRFYNPTCTPLYFAAYVSSVSAGRDYVLQPGQTLEIE